MSDHIEQIKILCVDDERNVLRALERIFLDDDYDIVTAGSGDEGLQVMETAGPFQIVISDYRMPGMNGVEFLKEVYTRWPETVRIVLSGYADAAAIVAAVNDGHIYKFIPKPWNDEELHITVKNCLERYSLLRRNRELLDELAVANQALEEKVQRRTEQLELRNRALEFSQSLLGNLPVGVVGLDQNRMIVYCNDSGATWLKPVCSDIFGSDIGQNPDCQFGGLVAQVLAEKSIAQDIILGDAPCRVLGRTIPFRESETIVLVLQKVEL